MTDIWYAPSFHKKDWYAPSEIDFSEDCWAYFILPYLNEFMEGRWPGCPDDWVERTDPGDQHKAPFIDAAEIAAEYDMRIKPVPSPYSTLLFDHYTCGFTFKELARGFNMDELELEAEAGWLIKYISGRRIKKMPYADWKKQVKYRQ